MLRCGHTGGPGSRPNGRPNSWCFCRPDR